MLIRLIGAVVGLVLTIAISTSAALADARVALVIGNSNYQKVAALPNPKNDAADMTAVLKRLDFKVFQSLDQTYGGMRRALRDFGNEAVGAEIALVYYAGHGIEVNRQNYLIPIDAALKTDLDVEFEAITLDLVMSAVQQAKGLRIVLLDACRNNPFAQSIRSVSGTRSIGRGLARVEPTVGTLVSYAAKEGTTADDGDGRNSPYTKALLSHLEEPGIDVQFLFRKVRDKVLEQTNGRQEPFTYGSLPGRRIFLKAPEPEAPKLTELEQDRLVWSKVKDSSDAGALENFLKQNPNNAFADFARQRIELLDLKQDQKQAEMQEQVAWSMVSETGNLSLLRNFLARYPGSKNSAKASKLIRSLEAQAQRKATKEQHKKAAEAMARKAAQAEADAKRQADEAAQKQADAAREQRLRSAVATAAWNVAKLSDNPAVLDAFVAQYPDSEHATLARQRVVQLKQKQKVALLQPKVSQSTLTSEQPDATGTQLAGKDLTLQVQRELARVGCSPGRADGSWGPQSRRALKNFAKHGKLQLANLDPSQQLLDSLSNRKARVCPLVCGPRHRAKGNRCVLKTCPRNQELTRSGTCIAKRKQPNANQNNQATITTAPKSSKPERSSNSGRKRCGLCSNRSRNTTGTRWACRLSNGSYRSNWGVLGSSWSCKF